MSRMSLRRLLGTTAAAGAFALGMVGAGQAADVTKARLENADKEPQNWITTFQNYSSHRFSRLNQINRDNVKNLKVAFSVPLSTGLVGRDATQLEMPPMVDDGFMYIDDAAGVFYKLDVRSGTMGKTVWRTDVTVAKDLVARSRGGALWGSNFYHNLADGRVVAINTTSGEVVWDKQIARVKHPKGSNVSVEREGFTAAPLAVDGRILVGNSKGDAGTNGWLAAVNAADGKEMWRTYTIPGPGEFGHDTWKDDHNAWKTGGAALWTTGSYDVDLKTTIWGAAQPVPMFDPEFRPGDNLYSNSAIGYDIDTGKIKWYFQYTPNESWDYDEQGVHMLVDAPFQGSPRKMVVHFGRNGFYYQLDRTNGNFLTAAQYVEKVTWTAGIDPKTGKPLEYDPKRALQTYIPATRFARADTAPKQACPALEGGVRWQPYAYNPDKRHAYLGGEDGCQTRQLVPAITLPDGAIDEKGRTKPGTASTQNLRGLHTITDVTTGQVKTRKWVPYSNRSGMLATSGGLVFTATIDGTIMALNDDTLDVLWSFNSGIPTKGPVVSYSVGGKQFIAIAAGSPGPGGAAWPELKDMIQGAMLYVFAL